VDRRLPPISLVTTARSPRSPSTEHGTLTAAMLGVFPVVHTPYDYDERFV
jgi:hypothetical protein